MSENENTPQDIILDDLEDVEVTKIEAFDLDKETKDDLQAVRDARGGNRKSRRIINSKKVVKKTAANMEVYDMVQSETWKQCVKYVHSVEPYLDTVHEDAVSEWLAANANGEFILNHLTKEVGFRKQEINDAFEVFVASL